MQQPDNQEQKAAPVPNRQQEFNAQLVKMVVLAACSIAFEPVSLLAIVFAYAGAEVAVALRIHTQQNRGQS